MGILAGVLSVSLVLGVGVSNDATREFVPQDSGVELAASETEMALLDTPDEIIEALDEVPHYVSLSPLYEGVPGGSPGVISPTKIGDPHPRYKGARVCSEHRYYKSDVAKVVNKLGTSTPALARLGIAGAIVYLTKKLAKKGLGVLGVLWAFAESQRTDPVKFWGGALAKITLGRARYVEHRVYCNYGGGYPAAYQSLTLH